MASLTPREKTKFELLFNMGTGYVLNFSDARFGMFFGEYNIDIHSEQYQSEGTSKAKKLRCFWSTEPDVVVGRVLRELVAYAEDYSTAYLEEESVKKHTKLVQECSQIANRLCATSLPLDRLKEATQHFDFDFGYIKDQIARMEKAVDSDPELAIGTAKELIETCCKTILTERKESFSSSAKMSQLSKATFKVLRLAPEDIPEDARAHDTIKMLLSNLASVGNAIAELRNEYGTGHGKDGRSKGLTTRHAKVAVGAASTLVVFLYDTHKER